MAVSLQARIEELGHQLARISRRLSCLESENMRLRDENAELQTENERLSEELKAARTDAEFLTMSHRLASGPESIILARRRIDSMIRDIDRCISQLKE